MKRRNFFGTILLAPFVNWKKAFLRPRVDTLATLEAVMQEHYLPRISETIVIGEGLK